MKIVQKGWGREEWIVNNKLYCGKFLYFNEGKKCSYHFHKIKDETFYIFKGKFLIKINGEEKIYKVGDIIRLKPGTKHQMIALKDGIIIEFSTQHFDSDSYRIEKGD